MAFVRFARRTVSNLSPHAEEIDERSSVRSLEPGFIANAPAYPAFQRPKRDHCK